MNPQTHPKQQYTTPTPQPNKKPIPTLEPESETHKTALEAAKLHQRRLEHAVLLSALRSRLPYSSIPGILASVSGTGGGGVEHKVKYDYRQHFNSTYTHNYNHSYSYQSGHRNVYVVPGGMVMSGIGYGQPRVLDDSFLRRAYKRRDFVRKRKTSSGRRSSARGSVGSEASSRSSVGVDS
ncbi:hypothetical protein BDV24DRAFT_126423 [Aspergillus arachidicola]|uniref:Uncharacterized protein n=1 Tax=Aspergillus arachidicola TaxID=656916 RepID=A0A5N6YHP8_9EURO|nr:hypothetical protein BDV24DRAFT_126423 [Aspergillus arachidicola]